jgi:membrane associated rhomboid family serine protease
MFFFPFATDAPIYHWPIVTVVMIVLNVAIYVVTGGGEQVDEHNILLLHSSHINPVEWVTTNFMHQDIVHLVGNMLFLWPFGLVAEGKLGWWRFLVVYLVIGTVFGAAIQLSLFALGKDHIVLGASAVIFGLLALCVAWAPRNDLKVFFFLVGVRTGVVDVSIMTFSGLYLAWEVLMFALAGFAVSSALLHIVGFAVGFPLGVALLKFDVVDCEGWDLLSVWSGKIHSLPDVVERRKEAETTNQQFVQKQEATLAREREAAINLIEQHVREGQGAIAYKVYLKHSGSGRAAWQLPDPVLANLLKGVVAAKMWPEAIQLLRQAIANSPALAAGARLKLAQILIQQEQRPRQALAVLGKLPPELPEAHSRRRDELTRLAEQAIDEGSLEMATEDW